MSGVRRISPWVAWPRDVGLGFSLSRDDIHADLSPVKNEETGLIEWRAIAWRGVDRDDVVAVVTGDTHWDAADLFAEEVLS